MNQQPEIDSDAFAAFEHEGWESVCAGYEAHFGRLTRQSSEPLLDATAVAGDTRLLDVCCGPGMISAAAAARGAHAVGLDFSAATVELAAARVPGVEFRQGDAGNLPFEDGEFDAAVCGFGIIHLPDPHRGLREMQRVVRPGGRIGVSVWVAPQEGNGFGLMYGAIKAHADMQVPLPEGPDFFQFSEPEKLDRALTETGFTGARSTIVEQTWEFERAGDMTRVIFEGMVRARGLVMAQTEAVRHAIVADIEAGMEAFRGNDGGYRVPMPAIVGSARK
ncbi:MAG: methyltransferase domain-containing protein [Gammaproteobacteria bacterium]|jgi:SAM-dependent methyltransferase